MRATKDQSNLQSFVLNFQKTGLLVQSFPVLVWSFSSLKTRPQALAISTVNLSLFSTRQLAQFYPLLLLTEMSDLSLFLDVDGKHGVCKMRISHIGILCSVRAG